jgi:hypothetical protein
MRDESQDRSNPSDIEMRFFQSKVQAKHYLLELVALRNYHREVSQMVDVDPEVKEKVLGLLK